MKENYPIYLPYQFHWRPHSVGGDSQLSHKKMKTLFLSNMSKSRRLTWTFFPIYPLQMEISLLREKKEEDLPVTMAHRNDSKKIATLRSAIFAQQHKTTAAKKKDKNWM